MSLRSLLGNSTSMFKTATGSIGQQVKGAAQNVKNNANNQVRGVINSAANAGVKGVVGAASSILGGDFRGALSQITNVPSQILGSLGRSGSSLLGLPGGGSFSNHVNGDGRGGDGLAGSLGRGDPLMSYNWYCDMPLLFPPSGASIGLTWNYVPEATIPFRNIEQRSAFRQGRMAHYAKSYSIDALQMSFFLDESGAALQYLQAWQDLIIAPTTRMNYAQQGGGFGLPAYYKKPIRIFLLSAAKQELIVFDYVECWPQNLNSLALNGGSNEALMLPVSFSVGDLFMTSYAVSTDLMRSLGENESIIQPILSSAYNSIANYGLSIAKNTLASSVNKITSSLPKFF